MKVIVAGSRDGVWPFHVKVAIHSSKFEVTELVSGTARGVDQMGEWWAKDHAIPVKRFPADWSIGKHAGYLRNAQMADYADALIAVWDGSSKGTKNMIEQMEARNKPVFVYRVAG